MTSGEYTALGMGIGFTFLALIVILFIGWCGYQIGHNSLGRRYVCNSLYAKCGLQQCDATELKFEQLCRETEEKK